jgi:hypothetical protein
LKKTLLLGCLLWLLSLASGVAALLCAEFGAPRTLLVPLLVWLCTVGLPTLSAVLLVVRLWRGPSFEVFLVCAAGLALVAQVGAVWAIRRLAGRFSRS